MHDNYFAPPRPQANNACALDDELFHMDAGMHGDATIEYARRSVG
jgi:hypothetical protein